MSRARAQYKVVPFMPEVKEKEATASVARQLDRTVAAYAEEGWLLKQVASVPALIQPGCLNFFGKPTQEFFTELIFERPSVKH